MKPTEGLVTSPVLARLELRLREHTPALLQDETGVRRAAVAVVLRDHAPEGPDILFIQRAHYHGDPWSGQIAFPGGRSEPGDTDLLETAIRETREETALDLSAHGRLLGRLDELRPTTQRIPAIAVQPYVIALTCLPDLRLSDEVADAFWVPLARLSEDQRWRASELDVRGMSVRARAFHHDDGRVIWGLTERILTQLLGIIAGEQ